MRPGLFAMSASKHKSVIYRRNRDYCKQFDQIYELNQDLYKCHMEARKVPKIGYMARMKKTWDILHPELNHLTEKYLGQQATYIEKRGYLLQIANVTNSNIETDTQIEDTSGQLNNIEVAEAINNSNSRETPPLEQICHVTLKDVDNELLQTEIL